jgi:hypothetical protein
MDFMLRLSFRPINACKELATSAVEVLAYRPEKKRDAGLRYRSSLAVKLALAKGAKARRQRQVQYRL